MSPWVRQAEPSDRSTTVLGTMTASTTGLKTFTLNTAGAAQVQAWIDNPASNYGFVLHDYANTDGFQFSSSEVTNRFRRPKLEVTYVLPAANLAPVADAGPDQTVLVTQAATFNAVCTDDGLPSPPAAMTMSWTKVGGPGTVTFADPTVDNTTATFDMPGTYVLRMTAHDGQLTGSDDVTVNVLAPANQGPVVSAGPDLSVTLPSPAALVSIERVDRFVKPPLAVLGMDDR
jgi:hypothetical protein